MPSPNGQAGRAGGSRLRAAGPGLPVATTRGALSVGLSWLFVHEPSGSFGPYKLVKLVTIHPSIGRHRREPPLSWPMPLPPTLPSLARFPVSPRSSQSPLLPTPGDVPPFPRCTRQPGPQRPLPRPLLLWYEMRTQGAAGGLGSRRVGLQRVGHRPSVTPAPQKSIPACLPTVAPQA
jgi:hypothetical protein